jgi:NADH-quinone oxidoreductase subunit L
VSIAAVTVGIAGGYALYRRWTERDPIRSLGPVYTLLENKYYLDDVYWKGLIRPVRDQAAAFVNWTNRYVLDGIVNGAGLFTRVLARGVSWFDHRVVDGAVNGAANTAGFTGGLLRYIQSGNVQRYAAFLFTGVVILAVIVTRI